MKEYVLNISDSGKIEGIQGISLMQYEHRVTRFAINISLKTTSRMCFLLR